jgi:hypothetical protein
MGIIGQIWPGIDSRDNRRDRGYRRSAPLVPAIEESASLSGSDDRGNTGHGIIGWLLRYWRRSTEHPARLALVERIALSPKHSLALIEADGVRLLVATSADGAPAFFPLRTAWEINSSHLDPINSYAPEMHVTEKLPGIQPQPISRQFQRNVRQELTARRLKFEGRVSW